MKFKILAILLIISIFTYNFAYAHSGRTNSSGCHNVTATGGYHCHSGGSSGGTASGKDPSSSKTRSGEESGMYVIGSAVILIGIYWILTDRDSCCLFKAQHSANLARGFLLNERPAFSSVSGLRLPELKLDAEEISGWRLGATYTFRY